MSLLEVRGLTVRDALTGALIVRDVHFCLEPGTCLGVVGESGSGKSLTCMALLGLAPPSLRVSGSVRFGGIDLLQAGRETMRGIRRQANRHDSPATDDGVRSSLLHGGAAS